ncbi:MAG: response regulator [Planctomycetaceae bacterium]|nr:response regulator [Planctomycetaceae bacterium]MCB9951235.1 response regulator [Planctomycetaceae bacterium]
MFRLLYQRLGEHYVLAVYFLTRLFAVAVGCCCIVYVNWTLGLTGEACQTFILAALIAISLSVIASTGLAHLLTPNLRACLRQRRSNIPVDSKLVAQAIQEAVLFPGQIAFWESWIDPLTSIAPICLMLHFDGIPLLTLVQVCVAGFLGLASIILGTFLWSEIGMQVVVRDLLTNASTEVEFDKFPQSSLGRRLEVGFSVTILFTAVMIGGLAIQRAIRIQSAPETAAMELEALKQQTVTITLVAVAAGLLLARLLSASVTHRIQKMLVAMKSVATGNLQLRLEPTGTDEIDRLGRQFNIMVNQLAQSDQELREFNSQLEQTVNKRTKQLRESVEQLEQLDRLKTQFVSNVSHELRTPLLMVLSPLAQLKKQVSPDAGESTNLINVAEVNARRLLLQINQLLDFSQVESGAVRLRVERIDVTRFMRSLAEMARPFAEHRGIQLNLDVPRESIYIAADPEKLDSVIRNLLSNAIKFTPPGGTVSLTACEFEFPGGCGVRMEVRDTGPGIEPEDLPKLFRRFSQLDGSTSREFAGTGLGLALVKELVELHGGTVGVDSPPGAGATFFVELPAGIPADVNSVEWAPDSSLLQGGGFAEFEQVSAFEESCDAYQADEQDIRPVILVVDDNAEVRAMFRRILSEKYQVAEAVDGEHGCSVARLALPDVIISDVMMPKMNGHEFCQAIKSDPLTAAIPFILVTARARVEMRVEGLDAGADDYLPKPFEEEELHARIRSLLRIRQMHVELARQNEQLRVALEERERMQAQLVQSEKLASMGQLVAGLAHEVNNAINPVCSGTMILKKRLTTVRDKFAQRGNDMDVETEILLKTLKLTETIAQSAQRTAQIVDDMKQFAHPGSGQLADFDLRKMLQTVTNLLRLQYRHASVSDADELTGSLSHGVTIKLHFGHRSSAYGPYTKIDQVFLNIIGNAIQAVGERGNIDIFTEENEDGWLVRICDDGPGIPAAIQSKIFDPFFTTKPPGQGTGLGLSICHSLVTGIGGSLTCRSEDSGGTEFAIRIPREVRFVEKEHATA